MIVSFRGNWLKNNKDLTNLLSYRPISNVNIIEKVVEDRVRIQLMEYPEKNIISTNHHGGRHLHSTISAKSSLDATTAKMLEKKGIVCMITTDLTAAFDLIDHRILVEKL